MMYMNTYPSSLMNVVAVGSSFGWVGPPILRSIGFVAK